MKILKNCISIACGLVLCFAATSCIQEAFDETVCVPPNGSSGKEHYVAIRIKGAVASPNTRAFTDEGLVDEEGEFEHAIGSSGNFAIFFKADGTFKELVPLKNSDLISDIIHEELDGVIEKGNNQEAIYKLKYEVPEEFEVDENQDLTQRLGYCVVVLNGNVLNGNDLNGNDINPPLGSNTSAKYDDLKKIIWKNTNDPTLIGRQGEYFTMSNSTFINGEIQGAQPFTYEVIQDGDSEFKWEKAITVYVERMSAKFEVDFEGYKDEANKIYIPADPSNETFDNNIRVFTEFDADGIPKFDSKKYDYRVKITGWGMNALERKEHLFKNVLANGNYFNGWSAPADYRTYWSEDPDYAGTEYPLQYRKAYDLAANHGFFNAYGENATNILRNYSYKEFVEANNFDKKIYIPENTYQFNNTTLKSNLGSRMDVLAGTHLLVTAELLTNIEDGERSADDTGNSGYYANDLYRDRLGNFYKTEMECFKVLVSRFNNAIQSNYQTKFYVYDWELNQAGDPYEANGKQLIAYTRGEYKLYHYGNELDNEYIEKNWDSLKGCLDKAEIKDGDGKRMLWLDGLTIEDKTKFGNEQCLKIITELKYKEDGNDNPIYRGCKTRDYTKTDGNGNVTTYTEVYERDNDKENITTNEIKSLIYEWVGPVDHFSYGKMYYYEPIQHTKDPIYGVVRNHWYKFNIVGVNDIGTSVDLVEDPIVPNSVPTIDRLNFEVKILPWHEALDTNAPVIQ